MTTQKVETVASKADFAIVAVAVLAAAAGVLGFTFLSEQPTVVRVGALAARAGGRDRDCLVLGAGQALPGLCPRVIPGDEACRLALAQGDHHYDRIVFGFVLLMAIFLFVVDKSLEWFLYDLLLRWR